MFCAWKFISNNNNLNDNILIIIIIHIDVPCPGLHIIYPALWSERNEVVTVITNKKHS